MKLHIKKGDNVKVLSGDDKNQTVTVSGKKVVLNRLRIAGRDTKGVKR